MYIPHIYLGHNVFNFFFIVAFVWKLFSYEGKHRNNFFRTILKFQFLTHLYTSILTPLRNRYIFPFFCLVSKKKKILLYWLNANEFRKSAHRHYCAVWFSNEMMIILSNYIWYLIGIKNYYEKTNVHWRYGIIDKTLFASA